MRIAVSDTAHASAVTALVDGNRLAAHTATHLAHHLTHTAGMAGDDSTAEDFATTYDQAATATLATLESLVGAYATLAHLLHASLTNHAHAEARSLIPDVPGWAQPFVGPPTPADHTIGILLADPPSSLGACDTGPDGLSGIVLGFLQDVFWPNADTDRVRTAATAWTTAADTLSVLTAHCDSATNALDPDHSPELPLARATITELRTHTDDFVTQLHDLATTCTDYADHVDQRRHELLELLEDLAQELLAGAALAGLLSTVSLGSAAGAATTIGAERLASATTKARSILDSLRAATTGLALKTQPLATDAAHIGTFTQKITRARIMLMETGGRAGRTRTGARVPDWLDHHESLGGHMLARHVGRSIRQLRQRFVEQPDLTVASTFRSRAEAKRAIEKTLKLKEGDIAKWLASGKGKRPFEADIGEDIGQVLIKSTDEVQSTRWVKIVLRPDSRTPEGWRLVTAHPHVKVMPR